MHVNVFHLLQMVRSYRDEYTSGNKPKASHISSEAIPQVDSQCLSKIFMLALKTPWHLIINWCWQNRCHKNKKITNMLCQNPRLIQSFSHYFLCGKLINPTLHFKTVGVPYMIHNSYIIGCSRTLSKFSPTGIIFQEHICHKFKKIREQLTKRILSCD